MMFCRHLLFPCMAKGCSYKDTGPTSTQGSNRCWEEVHFMLLDKLCSWLLKGVHFPFFVVCGLMSFLRKNVSSWSWTHISRLVLFPQSLHGCCWCDVCWLVVASVVTGDIALVTWVSLPVAELSPVLPFLFGTCCCPYIGSGLCNADVWRH